jgi:peroxiredoxin
MKVVKYLIFVMVVMVACSSEKHYTITGHIRGADNTTFLLQKRETGKTVIMDSAICKRGYFKMKGGAVDYPQMVQLVAKEKNSGTSFYIENSEISLAGSLDSLFDAKITGSKTQDEYQSFIDSNKPLSVRYSKTYTDYQAAMQSGNTLRIAEMEKEAGTIQNEMISLQKSFVRNNPGSYVAPSILYSLSYNMDAEEIESYLMAMDTNVAKIPLIKNLKERVEVMKTVVVGKKAPDFKSDDVNGNPVSLYSKIGPKLLLLDFWAAWCGPCRKENPNLVKVYNEYKKRGFDVFGVSLDSKKEEWIKAISEDNLQWTQVSDLLRGNNAAAKLYAVNVIPSNFLLDDKGIIIARNLTGVELYNKVKEILSEKSR